MPIIINRYLFVAFILLNVVGFTVQHLKGNNLRMLSHNSDKSVIHFTPASFKDYVLKHPRPYDVVILYTLKMNCHFCDTIKEEFFKVAESFYEQRAYNPDLNNKKRAVFFAVLHYSDEAKDIFKMLKLPTQTTIMYTTPFNIEVNDKNEPFVKYDEENIIAYKERRDFSSAHKILEFVNAKSRRSIELKKNPIMFLLYFTIFCSILYVGAYLYKHFKFVLLSPYIWAFVSLSVYIICIGGIVYNIIHGAPFAKFDNKGNIVEFIHSGQRSQYAGEGLLLSGLFVLIGTFMFLMTCVNRIPGYWNHKICFVCLCFLITILAKFISSLYRIKANWYRPEFHPPHNYIRGPLLKDQGISF